MVETKSVGVHYKTSFNQILRLPFKNAQRLTGGATSHADVGNIAAVSRDRRQQQK